MAKSERTAPNNLLKRERELHGWSQKKLAELINADTQNINRWERGKTSPSPFYRERLCKVFGKTAEELGLISPSINDDDHERLLNQSKLPLVSAPPTPMIPPPIWNVPYRRNLFFTGREDILEDLHDRLISSRTAALTQAYAISGLGGIGKTQTAVEYAYRYSKEYQVVLWVRADSHELLISDFVAIASLLNLPEEDEPDQSKVVNAVKQWLGENTDWLLILDNADNLEIVHDFIPSAGKGHILLTTRMHSMGSIAQTIEIKKMKSWEGTLLLLRRAKIIVGESLVDHISEAERVKAKAISEALDGLPLALDQAGAYIEETGCGLSDYFDLYQQRRVILLGRRGKHADHPEPVSTTWSLSFEKVEQDNSASAELLRLCTFLQPDAIPEEIITSAASELGPILQSVARDQIQLDDAIGELLHYSLLRRNPLIKILSVHRLVQEVLKDAMDAGTQCQWAERAVRAVSRAFPDADVANWQSCQRCLPHVRVCATLIEQWKMTFSEAIKLLYRSGSYLRRRALNIESDQFLQQALKLSEQVLGTEHSSMAPILNELGILYYTQSKFGQAEAFHQRALSIREKSLEVEDSILAESLNNLAELYDVQGKFDQAEPLYQRALTIRQQTLGLNHPDVARSLSNLAWLYSEQGKYTQAELLAQQALEICERVLGPDHLDIAYCLNSLAWLYYNQNNYAQAEPLLERALVINEKSLGLEHPEVAGSLNNLAKIYHKQGKYTQVEPLLQRVLMIWQKVWGPEHPDVAQGLHNLAELYYDQDKNAKAESLYLQAIAIGEKTLGPEHTNLAVYLNNLGHLYTRQGAYIDAEKCYLRALSIREHALGPDHPHVATSLESYAELLRKMNRESEANPLETRAQAIQAKHKATSS